MRTHNMLRDYLNLGSCFNLIKHVHYCVLNNYLSLPVEPPDCIDLLTSQKALLNTVLNLSRVKDNVYRTEQVLSTGKPLIVRIFEKGRRTFPDGFESQILARRVFYNGCIAVPDAETYVLVRLYWQIFYEDLLMGSPDRGVVMDFLKRRIGEPITPKEKSLTLNKKKAG